MLGGFKIGFENEMCRNLVYLFLTLLVVQVGIEQQAIGKCRCVSLVDESYWNVGDVVQPECKLASLLGFLALATIAVDWQSYDPTQDLVLLSYLSKVFFILDRIAANVGLKRTRPSATRIANGNAYPDGTVVNACQFSRFWPLEISSVRIPQLAQPS